MHPGRNVGRTFYHSPLCDFNFPPYFDFWRPGAVRFANTNLRRARVRFALRARPRWTHPHCGRRVAVAAVSTSLLPEGGANSATGARFFSMNTAPCFRCPLNGDAWCIAGSTTRSARSSMPFCRRLRDWSARSIRRPMTRGPSSISIRGARAMPDGPFNPARICPGRSAVGPECRTAPLSVRQAIDRVRIRVWGVSFACRAHSGRRDPSRAEFY